MDPITYIMNCYQIRQDDRHEVEKIFAGSPRNIDLALRMMAQCEEDGDFDEELAAWPYQVEVVGHVSA